MNNCVQKAKKKNIPAHVQIEIETTIKRTTAILATELNAVMSSSYVFSYELVSIELLHTQKFYVKITCIRNINTIII